MAAAHCLTGGKANLALSLVGYEDDVSAAMAYVFGDTFICADKQSAQAVTFDRQIGVKSVTLEGDVYDPSGTLSGGAAPSSSGLLVKVQELKAVEREIAEHQKIVDAVTRELAGAKGVIDGFRKDKRDLDLREHEVRLLEEQIGGSNATKVSGESSMSEPWLQYDQESVKDDVTGGEQLLTLQIISEVEAAKKLLAELKQIIEHAKEKQKAATAEAKRLEKEMADFKNNKDSKLIEIKVSRLHSMYSRSA